MACLKPVHQLFDSLDREKLMAEIQQERRWIGEGPGNSGISLIQWEYHHKIWPKIWY